MRIISATVLGLSLVAGCTIGDQGGGGGGGGGGGDDVTQADAAVSTTTPGVTAAVDRTTVATELGLTEMVTFTFTSTDSFAGDLTLTPTLAGPAGQAITDITVTGPSTVTLAANGSATAAYSIVIPTNADLATEGASGGVNSAESWEPGLRRWRRVDARRAVREAFGRSGGNVCRGDGNVRDFDHEPVHHREQGWDRLDRVPLHFYAPTGVTVKQGALIVFKNEDTATTHVTHGDGTGAWPHQAVGNVASGTAGNSYVVDTCSPATAGGATCQLAPGFSGMMGCHDHNGNGAKYTTYTTE